ncbi:hypothetical protein CEE37_08005 [candidate division LCP-89 bacterium B3_LCP]|uniref:Thioredoxin domain-containing protein n=1 Tax=candidate division LCP-89 bacterium B3_LCP TaxID=2012998 RepID=A0A532UZ83_UNCL8|nr:MAG: hypothetical protein CEE37_08005 [candidate division LCP-89 bacterium B3_LCP]
MIKRITGFILVFALTAALIACASDKKDQETQNTATAQAAKLTKAPDFKLQDENGENLSLADLKGKVVILDFWATWCPPCRNEIPHFIELQNTYGDKGLMVVGISVDQKGWSVVSPFIEEQGINYPVLLTDGEAYGNYQRLIPANMQGSIPFTFIIDREGNITERFVGYRDKAVFENAAKPLLRQ